MTEYLPWICDLCFLILVIGFLWSGWKKGFASMFVHAFSGLLALAAALLLYPYLADLLEKIGVTDALAGRIGELLQIEALLPSFSAEESLIGSLPLPGALKAGLIGHNTSEFYEALGVSRFSEYLTVYLARILVNGICLLVVFFVCLILLQWLARKLQLVKKVPLVGTLNSILGAICGLIIGLLIFAVISYLTTALSPVSEFFATLGDALSESLIAGWFIKTRMGLDLFL